MVPTVVLTKGMIWIEMPEHEAIVVESIPALTAALNAIRAQHPGLANWILAPTADVPFDDMVGAMDAARAAQFPHVTVASGPS